jgi:hypothetical protein
MQFALIVLAEIVALSNTLQFLANQIFHTIAIERVAHSFCCSGGTSPIFVIASSILWSWWTFWIWNFLHIIEEWCRCFLHQQDTWWSRSRVHVLRWSCELQDTLWFILVHVLVVYHLHPADILLHPEALNLSFFHKGRKRWTEFCSSSLLRRLQEVMSCQAASATTSLIDALKAGP